QHGDVHPVRPGVGVRRAGRGDGREDGARAWRFRSGDRDRRPGFARCRTDERDRGDRPASHPGGFEADLPAEFRRPMIDAVKAAGGFHVYLAPGTDGRFGAVLAELGLEGTALGEPETVATPAVIVLAPGEAAPEGFEDIAIRPPADAPPAALRELLRVALQNSVLKLDVRQLEEQARRQHRQFEELNRIGIALSAERDIDKLQEFILTTMRQLTNADGASLWLKTVDDDVPKLFLASSQNFSIDNTYQAFKVPVDEKSVVGYTVTMGTSQIYDDAYNPPPGKPQGGRGFDAQYGYRTKSMLTVPMRNYNNEVVGAVQLINAKRRFDVKLTVDTVEQEVVSFRPEDLEMIESIASQAAVAIDNKTLLDSIQALFDGFVQAKYATEKLEAIRSDNANLEQLLEIDRRLEEDLRQLRLWFDAIASANEPTVLPEDKASMLEVLSRQTYVDMSGREHPMLDPQEFRFLSIRKGTLDEQERLEMESHVTHSFHFLSKIPWTPIMRGIPEIAYGHHEKLDGT